MDLLEFEASLFYRASFRAGWATQRNPGGWENRKTGQEMPLPLTPTHTTPQLPRLRHTFGTPSPRDSKGVREPRTHGPPQSRLRPSSLGAPPGVAWATGARPPERGTREGASGARSRSPLSSPGLFH